ncbi:Uncharacterised protein [Mycobacteroides abscessus subsp. abscessus]|nr:Uncharacterised protein [Mycobacteroides abscessus subsp. abscessus]
MGFGEATNCCSQAPAIGLALTCCAAAGDCSFSAAMICGYVQVVFTIAVTSGSADAIPPPATSDNATAPEPTTNFAVRAILVYLPPGPPTSISTIGEIPLRTTLAGAPESLDLLSTGPWVPNGSSANTNAPGNE